jgi:Flp pilus assembly protein TadG
MKNYRVRSQRYEKGSVLVESAICIPVLLVILFGIIQYGMILSAVLTLRNAASVGAREAALSASTCAEIDAAVNAAVATMLPGTATIAKAAGSVAGTYQVSLTYDLPLIIPYVVPGSSGGTMTLNSSAVMKWQQASACGDF